MGRAKPIELPGISFAKQGDAELFFQKMLHRYADGERINAEDSILLAQLLRRHPDDKIGIGVDYFYRQKNPDQPTSGFHISRADGEWTDFSYLRCIKGEKPTAHNYFYRACRFAVSSYLTLKKNSLFDEGPVFCSATGSSLTKETSEYRHTEPSFKALVDGFIQENGVEVTWSLFPEDRDRQYNVIFQDRNMERSFISYHKANAKLALFKK
jgi:hypothetical protein